MTDRVWMGDAYGAKAYVPKSAVDRWKPHGWTQAEGPAGDDRVWMQHEGHEGKAQFPAGIAQTWEALGWKPSEPPEPYDVTKDPALVDVPEAPPTPAAKSTKTGAAGSDKKE